MRILKAYANSCVNIHYQRYMLVLVHDIHAVCKYFLSKQLRV